MIVGGPVGHLVGDPVEQGSLTRNVDIANNKSTYTFGTLTGIFSGLSYVLKDSVDSYFTISPIEVLNINQSPAAIYIYGTQLADVLKNPGNGLLLDKVTSTTFTGIIKYGVRFVEPFVRIAVGLIRNNDSRFNAGKFLNGREN